MKIQAVKVATSTPCVLMGLVTSAAASAATYPLASNATLSMQEATRSQTRRRTKTANALHYSRYASLLRC